MVGIAVQVRCCHRDDEARCAEPALAAVMVDHFGLYGVGRAVGCGHPFDCADRFSVQLWQEQDASVQRLCPILIRDHDRAGSAVPFIAALFGACQVLIDPQPIKQRGWSDLRL